MIEQKNEDTQDTRTISTTNARPKSQLEKTKRETMKTGEWGDCEQRENTWKATGMYHTLRLHEFRTHGFVAGHTALFNLPHVPGATSSSGNLTSTFSAQLGVELCSPHIHEHQAASLLSSLLP